MLDCSFPFRDWPEKELTRKCCKTIITFCNKVWGVRKVTTGITGLWPPSDQSDVAFWFFDVGSSYHPEAAFWKRWIVHPCKGTWAGFRPSRDRLVLSYRFERCLGYRMTEVQLSTRGTVEPHHWIIHLFVQSVMGI